MVVEMFAVCSGRRGASPREYRIDVTRSSEALCDTAVCRLHEGVLDLG